MKILVVSDTHGTLDGVRKAIEQTGQPDMVIHLGDIIKQDEKLKELCRCPVKIVQGNCDFNSEYPLVEIVEFGKNRAFVTHGHYYQVDWGIDRLCYAADGNNCNIAMFGHTHEPRIVDNKGIVVLNPGSLTRPRQPNRRKSYILIHVDEKGEAKAEIKYL